MKQRWNKGLAALCLALLLSPALAGPVSANSGYTYWKGTSATGAVVTDETCPLVVTREELVFDLPDFPQGRYRTAEELLTYPGRVTAAYTFYNPADYTVTATLVFPFGTVPTYGRLRDPVTDAPIPAPDTQRYEVTLDGAAIPKTLRHTFSPPLSQFDPEVDLARLHDGFLTDGFYRPDLPVTRYTYQVEGVDLEAHRAAYAAFVYTGDPAKTKVLMTGQNGGELLDDGVRLGCWVETGTFVLSVLGEPLAQLPAWTFYENGTCRQEIEGRMVLTDTQTTTLAGLLLTDYDPAGEVLDYDWYNAVLTCLRLNPWTDGVLYDPDFSFDVSDQLMRWYEYEITVPPGGTAENTVTAPIYPTIDLGYDPPIYQYTYLLSPAQCWAGFGAVDLFLRTPFVLVESSLPGFAGAEGGYTLHLDGLPRGELTFTLSTGEHPVAPGFWGAVGAWIVGLPAWALPAAGAALALAGALLLGRRRRTRRRPPVP